MTTWHGAALVASRHGGPEVLEVVDHSVTDPGPDEAVVEVSAVGVNYIDVYQREGIYPTQPPFVVGNEGAGTVVAAGENSPVAVGAQVAWAMVPGSAAAFVRLPAAKLVPVPDSVGPELAAAALLQGMTAQFLAESTFPVTDGTWALVQAAAGGVGQLLVQLIVARGGIVVAAAGGPDKCATAAKVGAQHVVDYTQVADLAQAVREASDGRGVDVAYDGVGKATFDASLASLRPRGLLALFGGASGQVPPFDLQRLNTGGSLYVTRPSLAHYVADREELLARADVVLSRVGAGELTISIDSSYPFSQAAEAYRALEGRQTQGKLLLLPG